MPIATDSSDANLTVDRQEDKGLKVEGREEVGLEGVGRASGDRGGQDRGGIGGGGLDGGGRDADRGGGGTAGSHRGLNLRCEEHSISYSARTTRGRLACGQTARWQPGAD